MYGKLNDTRLDATLVAVAAVAAVVAAVVAAEAPALAGAAEAREGGSVGMASNAGCVVGSAMAVGGAGRAAGSAVGGGVQWLREWRGGSLGAVRGCKHGQGRAGGELRGGQVCTRGLAVTGACLTVCRVAASSVWFGLVPLAPHCFVQFSSASVVDCCLYWFLGVAGILLSSQCDTACTTALDMTAGKQTPVHVATPCLKVDLSRIELLPEMS